MLTVPMPANQEVRPAMFAARPVHTPSPKTHLMAWRARASRPGFTLLEVMLVLLIIGALAAAVAFNFAGAGERAKGRTTRIGMNTLKNALVEYAGDKGAYPSTTEGLIVLVPAYVETKALKDAWKRPYQYYAPTDDPNRPYDLFSLGGDGVPNTPDDLSVWDDE